MSILNRHQFSSSLDFLNTVSFLSFSSWLFSSLSLKENVEALKQFFSSCALRYAAAEQ